MRRDIHLLSIEKLYANLVKEQIGRDFPSVTFMTALHILRIIYNAARTCLQTKQSRIC